MSAETLSRQSKIWVYWNDEQNIRTENVKTSLLSQEGCSDRAIWGTFHQERPCGQLLEKVQSRDPFVLKSREAMLIKKFYTYRHWLNKELSPPLTKLLHSYFFSFNHRNHMLWLKPFYIMLVVWTGIIESEIYYNPYIFKFVCHQFYLSPQQLDIQYNIRNVKKNVTWLLLQWAGLYARPISPYTVTISVWIYIRNPYYLATKQIISNFVFYSVSYYWIKPNLSVWWGWS